MALASSTVETATRLLVAIEQRLGRLYTGLVTMRLGTVTIGDQAIPLSAAQKTAINGKISTIVANLETIMGALETTVRGTTTVVPGPAGVGITDFVTAMSAMMALMREDQGANVRQNVWEAVYRDLGLDRGDDGELTAAAVPSEKVAEIRQMFDVRVNAIKLLLVQLRALGA